MSDSAELSCLQMRRARAWFPCLDAHSSVCTFSLQASRCLASSPEPAVLHRALAQRWCCDGLCSHLQLLTSSCAVLSSAEPCRAQHVAYLSWHYITFCLESSKPAHKNLLPGVQVTVSAHLTAVGSGVLQKRTCRQVGGCEEATFHYSIPYAVPASHIGLAAGETSFATLKAANKQGCVLISAAEALLRVSRGL